MRSITFEITDNENKALLHNCANPQDWIENAVGHLINRAKDTLVEKEIERQLNDPSVSTITNDRDTLVRNYNGPLLGNPNG
tara:strand:- start:9197 stop:9439 length:243 start_codon:yes stop_codon:yes gene_type:complete